MRETAPSNNPDTQRRRSTRILQAVPLTVIGVDALGRPFQERTSTLIINCHGCRYQSKHYVLKNMWITLEVPHPEAAHEPRSVRARVMWIQRPRTVRELFQVGVELEVAGNFWGIAFPPHDWFPFPEGLPGEVPVPAAAAAPPEPETSNFVPELAAPSAEPPPSQAAEETVDVDNVRTMPLGGGVEPSLVLARQMTRLVNEARQQLQTTVRESAIEAVTLETKPLLAALQAQIKDVAEKSIAATAGPAAEQTLRSAQESQLDALRHEWDSNLRHSVEQAVERLAGRLVELEDERRAAFERQLEQQVQRSIEEFQRMAGDLTSRLSAPPENIEQLRQQTFESHVDAVREGEQRLAAQTAETRAVLEEIRNDTRALQEQAASAVETARANLRSQLDTDLESHTRTVREAEQHLQAQAAETRAALDELKNNARKLQEGAASALEAARSNWRTQVEGDFGEALRRWNERVENSMQAAIDQARERLADTSQTAAERLEREVGLRITAIGKSFVEAATETERSLGSLRASLEDIQRQAHDALGQADSAVRRVREQEARLDSVAQAAGQELERRAGALLDAQSEEIARRAETALQAWTEHLQPVIEASGQQAVARLGSELQQTLNSHVENVGQLFGRLDSRMEEIERTVRARQEQLSKDSEESLQNTLESLKGAVRTLEKEFDQAGKDTAAKWLAEIEAKATETTHTTFEALFKSADWYEKKVQTQMQNTLERGLDQANATLRDKAGEISRLFASELDHYSRSYVEHTQGQLEETVREHQERTRRQSAEAATVAAASISEHAREKAKDAMGQLDARAAEAARELQSRMDAQADTMAARIAATGERLSAQFDEALKRQNERALGEAREQLNAQIERSKGDLRQEAGSQERQLRDKLAAMGDQAIADYKTRLENASNSWLLATVTRLNQQSEQFLDSVAKLTEERLRQTCSDVFAGVGETLRRRMLDLHSPAPVAAPKPPVGT